MKISDLVKIKMKWWQAFLFFILISSVIVSGTLNISGGVPPAIMLLEILLIK